MDYNRDIYDAHTILYFNRCFSSKVLFFPENQPNYINVFVELPVGTNIAQNNQTTLEIKKEIDNVLNSPISDEDTLSYYEVVI